MATTLSKFLASHLIKKNIKDIPKITHTRIGDKPNNIYGGAYCIEGDDVEEFYKLVHNEVIVGKKLEYLTEKQKENVMYVDLDFHYEANIESRQHTLKNIETWINLYLDTIKKEKYFDFDESPFEVYIMQKDGVNRLADKTKDGVHILFGINVPNIIQLDIRKKIIERLTNEKENYEFTMPLKNELEKVFDEGLSKGTTNAQLFGCRKPAHDAYKLVKAYKFNLDLTDNEFCQTVISTEMNYELFKKLCVRNDENRVSFKLTTKALNIMNPELSETMKIVNHMNFEGSNSLTDLQKLYDCFSEKRIDKFDSWIQLGWATFNAFGNDQEAEDIFVNANEKVADRNVTLHKNNAREKYRTLEKEANGLGIGSLHYWAREDNIELYKQHFKTRDLIIKKVLTKANEDIKIVYNDNEAANIVFEMLKDRLSFCNNQLFYKNENVWICDKKVDDYILDYIMNKSQIYKNDAKGKPIPFSQNISNAKNIRESLYAKVRTQINPINIYDKFHTTTKGRLCFLDGVYSFPEKRFYEWSEIHFEYYTTVQIKRNFAEYFKNPDRTLMEKIKDYILKALFGTQTDIALQLFSRAMAGHYEDKYWSKYMGNRDCGKGVLFEAFEAAFGDYIGAFEGTHIVCDRNSRMGEDASKKLYWAIQLQFCRISISQEMPADVHNKKLDSSIIKKLCSGGDKIKARRNYDKFETEFKNGSMLVILANDIADPDSPDAMEKCWEFNSVVQFKSKAEIECMRINGEDQRILDTYLVADPKIKEEVKTDEYANAFVMLLIENYQDTRIPKIKKQEEEEFSSLRKKILDHYEITCNEKDKIYTKDMKEWRNIEKIDVSDGKFKTEMLSIGITMDKGRRYWCGLIEKKTEEVIIYE